MSKPSRDFTIGKESKILANFTGPILFGNLCMQMYNIVNAVVVGHFLGREALAAVGAAFPIIFLLVSLIIGIGMGGTVLASQYFASKEFSNLRKAIDTTYIFIILSGLFMSIVGIIFTPQIFKLTNLSNEVLPMATVYMRIFLSGLVVMFGFNGISSILRGLGDSKTPVYYLIGSNILNLILSVVFILLGWGIAGVAWSSVISQVLALLLMNFQIKKHNEIACIRLKGLQWDTPIFKRILKIGLPSGFQQSFVALGQTAILSIANTFGTAVTASYSVIMRLDSFASMPAMSFSQAITTFVGQNLAARKTARVRRGLRYTIKINIIISVVIGILFVLLGKWFMHAFTKDQEVIDIGYKYLLICGPFYVIYSIMFIFTGLFRGAGDTLVPMFITLFSLWIIRIPLAYFLSREFGYVGIYWSVPIGWLSGFLGSTIYYRQGKWRHKVVARRLKQAE